MAKEGLISNREAGAYNKAITERPCTYGCGGVMHLAVVMPRHKTIWSCNKCFEDIPKISGDWSPPPAEKKE